MHRQTLDFQDLAAACSKKGARDVVSTGQDLLMDRIRALGALLRSGGVTVEVRHSCPGCPPPLRGHHSGGEAAARERGLWQGGLHFP